MQGGIDCIGVGCGAHIVNEHNQILLQKRSKHCTNRTGFWSIPGGKVEFFETVEEALKREIQEELGVEIEIVRLLCVSDDIIKEERQHWVSPQYLCKIVKGVPTNREPQMCDEIQWFDLANLPSALTTPTLDGIRKWRKMKE